MLFVMGSMILSSYLTLSFKVTERYRVNNLLAIVFNYVSCVYKRLNIQRSFSCNHCNSSPGLVSVVNGYGCSIYFNC